MFRLPRAFPGFACLGLACLALAALAGCGAAPASPRTAPGTLSRFESDPRVIVYTSNDWSFSTHTFFLEGRDGLVAIDTQFLPSAAAEARAGAEALTGKRVVVALVLHPNPDKFNGAGTFLAGGARVLTSAAVAERVPAVHAQRKAKFFATYAPDYPAEAAPLETFEGPEHLLEAAGLRLRLRAVGPGCSGAHVLVDWEGHVFGGDLVAAGTTAGSSSASSTTGARGPSWLGRAWAPPPRTPRAAASRTWRTAWRPGSRGPRP